MDRGVLIQGKGVILGDHEIWELYLPPNTILKVIRFNMQ